MGLISIYRCTTGESGMVIARTAAAGETLASLLADAIPAAHNHAKSMPNSLNGMVFSLKEIRENLWMHYGLRSLTLPTRCDGCSKNFSEHARLADWSSSITMMWQGNGTVSVLQH